MRIVLITSKLKFEDDGAPVGGSVVDLHLKAKGLTELGHEVSVITAFSEADRIPCTLPYAVFERRIKQRGLFGLQFGVYALLKEFERDADAFYIDGHMFLYGGGAYRLFGGNVPVVGFFNIRLNAWADTADSAARPPLYRCIKKMFRIGAERVIGAPIANHLDAFIFNTPQVQRMYHDFGVGKNGPNAVIPDFVATQELTSTYSISERSIKERQGTVDPLILFAAGRMIPEKGFELLIRAFSLLRDKDTYRVVLSGGGPDKERLEELVSELGLSEYIVFPGWVEKKNLYESFKKAHVFVFPKWWSEYGSAVLTEAMAFGLPSIIPGGGALEWLTAGAALTFRNNNVADLSRAILELGEDTQLRVSIAKKGFAHSASFDYRVLGKKLEKILLSLVKPP